MAKPAPFATAILSLPKLAQRTGKRLERPVPDCPGLHVVAQKSGAPGAFFYRYRSPSSGKNANLRLGPHEAECEPDGDWQFGEPLTLDGARVLAARCRDYVRRKIDPRDVVQGMRATLSATFDELEAGPTVATVLPQFFTKYARGVAASTAQTNASYCGLVRDKTGAWIGHNPARGLHAAWGHKPASTLTEKDAHAYLDRLRSRTVNGQAVKGVSANRTHALLKGFGEYLRQQGMQATNPFALMHKLPVKEQVRSRVLDDTELLAFWRACEVFDYPWGRVGQLTLLSACRPGTGNEPGEVLGAEWKEFDLAGRCWTLPARTGNKTQAVHTVWLSDLALGVLERLPRNGPFLFQAPDAKAPYQKQPRAKVMLDKAMAVELSKLDRPFARFTWHDLRRTAFTTLQRCGFADWICHACTNHKGSDRMKAVYGHHKFERDKRRALFTLGRYVALVLEPERYRAALAYRRQGNDLEAHDAADDAFYEALRAGGVAWGDWLAQACGDVPQALANGSRNTTRAVA
jgi:integrase